MPDAHPTNIFLWCEWTPGTEVDILIGDPAKAKRQLGWQPTTLFTALVDEMVAAEVEAIQSVDGITTYPI